MSEFWHKLGCCVVEKPQPKKKRRRIDRTMIGEPMNFVHLTHIGSGEMGAGDGLAMVLLSVTPTLSSPEEMLPPPDASYNQCPQGLSFPYSPNSASKGLGAGLPLLPLARAPPGDGVKAAGLTNDYWLARGAQLKPWTLSDLR
uniref:CDC42 small effector protein 1 n=2 Tax=Equus TaxID=9789 RepID=A0A9L0TJ65_HORSE